MVSSVPAIDIALVGTYSGYLASRLDGIKSARRLRQFEAYGKYDEFTEGDGDGDKPRRSGPLERS